MAWIKRNLYFFIGSIVAVALMAAGGYYLFTQVSQENQVAEEINKQYEELKRLINQNPHPGYKDINNIKAAKEEADTFRAYVGKVQPHFHTIPPIPDMGGAKIGDSDFATALRVTVNDLHNEARRQSVLLSSSNYYFSFEAQKNLMIFEPTSLDKLAVELGEVKAISDILFSAKINSLDYIRREVVSTNQDNNQSDYLTQKTISTPLADLTPYEVKFRCFSTELGLVLSSLASSSDGFIVKSMNVEPTSSGPEEVMPGSAMPVNATIPAQQYRDPRTFRGPPVTQPVAVTPAVSHKTETFLNEKPFTVTLLIQVVKIKSEAKTNTKPVK